MAVHPRKGACDWYITERDSDPDGEGQIQAFGFANLGDRECAELGYISIVELIRNGVEIDLYWQSRTLGEVKADMEAAAQFEGAQNV